jgi:disulfide oxidoreductase YuzD
MTANKLVKIRILDLPGVKLGCCPENCDPNFISVQTKTDELRSALEEAYPERTSTEYVNLLWKPQEQGSEFGQLLVTKRQPSPLVIIDGEAKYAGSIQVKFIVSEVGKILRGPVTPRFPLRDLLKF